MATAPLHPCPAPVFSQRLKVAQTRVTFLAKASAVLMSRGGTTTKQEPLSEFDRQSQIYEHPVSPSNPQRVQTRACWDQE